MPLFIWAQCRCAKRRTFSPRRPPMRSSLRHAGRLCQCMHTESALRQAGVFPDRRASTCMKLQADLLLTPYCFTIQFALQPRNASPVLGAPCDSSTGQHDRVRCSPVVGQALKIPLWLLGIATYLMLPHRSISAICVCRPHCAANLRIAYQSRLASAFPWLVECRARPIRSATQAPSAPPLLGARAADCTRYSPFPNWGLCLNNICTVRV